MQPIRALRRSSTMHAGGSRARGLKLYRDLLRALLRFPQPHLQSKIHANLREAFEIYRDVIDQQRREEALRTGELALRMLREWSELKPEHAKILFGGFNWQTKDS